MPLRTRLFVLLTGLALIPLGLALGWQAFDHRANRRTVEEFHGNMAEFVASNIVDWKAQENKRMTFLYDLEKSSAKDLNVNAFKLFQQATAAGSDILSAALIAPDGTAAVSLQAETLQDGAADPAGDPLVAAARQSRQAAFGPLQLSAGEPAVAFVYPLPDGHVVRLLLSLHDVWKRLADRKLGLTGRVFLVDSEGTPLPGQEEAKQGVPASADVFGLGGQGSAAPVARVAPGDLDAAAVKSRIAGAPRGFDPRLPSRAGSLAVSWLKVPDFPWTVLTVQRRSEALAAEDRWLTGLLVFVTISLLLGMGAATAISGRVSGPVLALVAAAKRVAARDYGAPVEAAGWPEFVQLAETFNAMTAQLKLLDESQLQKILEEKAKAETLVRTIPDGVLMVDGALGVVYANPPGLKLLGLPEALSGRPSVLGGLPAQSTLRAALEHVLRSEGPGRADARVAISKEPFIEKQYRVYSSPYALAGGKEKGRVLVLRDVTAEMQAETQKTEQFLMIAHDMRGSLSVIEGGTDIMGRLPGMPEKAAKYARAMRSAGRTLLGMVNDILLLNKMEAGLMELKPAPVSVAKLLAACREAQQVPAEMRGLSVVDDPPVPDVELAMDQALIERVIANLAGNALKFTPAGGRITLSCAAVEPGSVRLCVSDTGPGIPPDKQAFIFEKYGQLEAGKQKGFGLGLAMCRMAVELHGGRIWVESELGKGSRFYFTLSRQLKPAA